MRYGGAYTEMWSGFKLYEKRAPRNFHIKGSGSGLERGST